MCPVQKKLSGHPNIVQFCSAASISKEQSDTGQAEFLILTELCRGTTPHSHYHQMMEKTFLKANPIISFIQIHSLLFSHLKYCYFQLLDDRI